MRGFFIALVGCFALLACAGPAWAQGAGNNNDTGLTDRQALLTEKTAPSSALLDDNASLNSPMPLKGPDIGAPPQLPPDSEDTNFTPPSAESPITPLPAQRRGSEVQNNAPPPPEAPQSFHK